jgi:8-oxo-dGTP diphosphatase
MSALENRPKVGIGVFVVRDGRILLGRRKGAHGEGTWSLPGGHLEFGESWHACACREVLEETGIVVTRTRFASVTNDVFVETGKHYVTVFMIASEATGDPEVLEPDKCHEWQWHVWEQFPEPLFLPVANLRQTEFHPLNA